MTTNCLSSSRKDRALQISLVIPAYNAGGTIEALLDSTLAQTLPRRTYEVIVVDDGSTDETATLAGRYANIRVLRRGNRGPGAARDYGASLARGEIIAYTDADCVLSCDWLEKHVQCHRRHPQVDAVGGSVIPAVRLKMGSVRLADHLCSWFNAHDRLPESAPEYLPSANFSVKRRVLAKGVRWSHRRTTGEDVEFCRELRARGMGLRFVPDITLGHVDRATYSGFLRHQYNWGFHAPHVRGFRTDARFSFLFPKRFPMAMLLSPGIVLGYTALIVCHWWRFRPLALASVMPLILAGKIAYARGVLAGTKSLKDGRVEVPADQRTLVTGAWVGSA